MPMSNSLGIPVSGLVWAFDLPSGQREHDGDDDLAAAVERQLNLHETHEAQLDDTFEPWEARKPSILSRYTTNEKLSIVSSFLGPGTTITRKDLPENSMQSRLDELEDDDNSSPQRMQDLSQQDYINRIDQLKTELKNAWANELRVRSLKIVIQCAKMLSDVSVAKFYPSQFVLITDILDTFGNLVFDRLLVKAEQCSRGTRLQPGFTPDMVPRISREICKNWFFKIASIRELLPRIYVEAALLRNRRFMGLHHIEETLIRLARQTRGIADPLVAIYTRCYLCRVGMSLMPQLRGYLLEMFHDTVSCFKQFTSPSVKNLCQMQMLDRPTYLNLYVPAVDWILQCVAYRSTRDVFDSVLASGSDSEASSVVLNAIMSSFPPEMIAQGAEEFIQRIQASPTTGLKHHHLYRSLGVSLTFCPPEENIRRAILNQVWESIRSLEDPADYMACAEVWIEYPVKYFGTREVNVLLGDVIAHVQPDRAFENLYPQLQSMLIKVIGHQTSFSEIFAMDNFMTFLDLFQKEDVRVEVAKSVLRAFSSQSSSQKLNNTVTVNAIMYLAKILHDSLSATSLEDDRRDVTALLVAFVNAVDFGKQFEQTLQFYVDARSNFSNLDAVMVVLVHCVNNLMMRTLQAVAGNHNRKSGQFVRSCAAFNYITVPSIKDPIERLRLFVLSGSTAVTNQALAQADEFFTTCVNFVRDIPPEVMRNGELSDISEFLTPVLLNLLSALLMVPDNPELEPLAVLKGLLKVLAEIDCVILLCRCAMVVLSPVEANDDLYGGNSKYLKAIETMTQGVLQEIEGGLAAMQSQLAQAELRATIAADVFTRYEFYLYTGANRREQTRLPVPRAQNAYTELQARAAGCRALVHAEEGRRQLQEHEHSRCAALRDGWAHTAGEHAREPRRRQLAGLENAARYDMLIGNENSVWRRNHY
ncbi:uncharacterized protein MONBRDRAFT_11317 [Monosiga brevicollis MX1]|uniref:VPS35 endosomal protein-sorting factor-like n=1 Tax=Monosiga brevicollis TaxID=81824 RepID=A9V8V8_MONBE|nr:uncharacterized protein MONBRDRAFT_11317 [Monosiga brevicollis MX1]EDQ85942.1 predicted protein [Monosiga brevicollis MX1]|eukprot:XP_001749136.1 hypothetical protein [Monosiga brevicollis MX1]